MNLREEKVIPTIEHSYIANMIRMHNDTEYKALLSDIRDNGQRDPIEVWKGKVIDGRNRQRVCAELCIGVNVVYLPDSMTELEVTKRAISSNKRRKDTATDRAVQALNLLLSNTGWTYGTVVASCNTSRGLVHKAKYLHEHHQEQLRILSKGGSVAVMDNITGIVKHYNKLGPLFSVLKSNDEHKVCEVVENEVSYGDALEHMFHSEAAREDYKVKVGSYNRLDSRSKEGAYKKLMIDYLRTIHKEAEKVAYDFSLEGANNE